MTAPDLHRRQAAENLERVATMLRSTDGLRTRDPALALISQAQAGALIAIGQALLDISETLHRMAPREEK